VADLVDGRRPILPRHRGDGKGRHRYRCARLSTDLTNESPPPPAPQPSGPGGPPVAEEPGDPGDWGDEPDESIDRRPSWPQIVLLALACLFAGGAAVYWWEQRPPRPNAADVGFYDDMTVHHQQAIDMSIDYLEHGKDRVLRQMANEIVLFQAGDIRTMQTAISDWHKDPNDDVAMAWMGSPVPEDRQPGMATSQEMERLAVARGSDLDELVTRLMINHHAGGAHMADAEVRLGRDHDAVKFATAMASGQRMEIEEMNHIRRRLGFAPVAAPLAEPEPTD
jgi:uncharacterized protein (DUF305 family)